MSTTQYQVLVRSGSYDLFVASVLGIEDCVGRDGREKKRLPRPRRRSSTGLPHGEVISIDVENGSMSAANVWREEAGRFPDDPTFDEFVTETQSDRRNLDSEDPAP